MQTSVSQRGDAQASVVVRAVYYVLATVLVAIGLIALRQRLVEGLRVTALSSTITWGLWIAFYIFFVGLSAGSFLLSTMIYVFNMHQLERVGRLALLTAILALVGAMLFVWVDLGHPERVWRTITNWQGRSVMAIEFVFYVAYIVLMLVELWYLMRLDLAAAACRGGIRGRIAKALALGFHYPVTTADYSAAAAQAARVVRTAGIIGIPIAIGVHGGTGAIFGVLVSRPYWNGGLFPIMFIVSALASGAALTTFLYAVLGRRDEEFQATLKQLAGLMVLFIGVDALLLLAEFVTGLYHSGTDESAVLAELMFGQFKWNFWVGQVGLAFVLPVLLVTLGRRSAVLLGAAGLSMVLGIATMRYDLVVPAYINPVLHGLDRAYRDARMVYQYSPAVSEWLISVGVIALLALILAVALEILPMGQDIQPIGATRRA